MTGLLLLSALVGATLIVVRSTLFRPLQRRWPALFGCSQCTGAWVGTLAGAAVGLLGLAPLGRGVVGDAAVTAIVLGGATSLWAMVADAVLLNLLGDPKG